jgi:hypothetical protein
MSPFFVCYLVESLHAHNITTELYFPRLLISTLIQLVKGQCVTTCASMQPLIWFFAWYGERPDDRTSKAWRYYTKNEGPEIKRVKELVVRVNSIKSVDVMTWQSGRMMESCRMFSIRSDERFIKINI